MFENIKYMLIIAVYFIVLDVVTSELAIYNETFNAAFNAVVTLCYGVVASIIFYWINVLLPKEEKSKRDAIVVAKKLFEMREHALLNLWTLDNNVRASAHDPYGRNPTNPYAFTGGINLDFEIKAAYLRMLELTRGLAFGELLVSTLSVVIRPEQVGTMDCNGLRFHYLQMNEKFEVILWELKKKKEDKFAQRVLAAMPRKLSAFEHAVEWDYKRVYMSILDAELQEKVRPKDNENLRTTKENTECVTRRRRNNHD